jgi:flagellar biosynthesis regulator FlbT
MDGSFLRNIPGIGAVLRATEALRGAGRQTSDRGGQERTAGRVLAAQRKQEIKASQDVLKLRKQEITALKAKTALDQLKEKFDIELIGLQKARNEATDQEVKLRLNGLIAIAKNDEALAKKALAELNAAEAAEEFAKKFNIALEAVRSMTDKINKFIESQVGGFEGALESIKSLNARIAAMISKLGGTSGGGGGGGAIYDYALSEVQAKNEQIKAFEYNLGLETTRELNARIGEFVAQQSSSQAPTEIRVTVDANSDRLSQAIAESIQIANRSGYSTIPAGFIA